MTMNGAVHPIAFYIVAARNREFCQKTSLETIQK